MRGMRVPRSALHRCGEGVVSVRVGRRMWQPRPVLGRLNRMRAVTRRWWLDVTVTRVARTGVARVVALHRRSPVLCLLLVVRSVVRSIVLLVLVLVLLLVLVGILVAVMSMPLRRRRVSRRRREVREVHVQQVRCALARGRGRSGVRAAPVVFSVASVVAMWGLRRNGLKSLGALRTTADAPH